MSPRESTKLTRAGGGVYGAPTMSTPAAARSRSARPVGLEHDHRHAPVATIPTTRHRRGVSASRAEWQAALELFTTAQLAAGLSPATVAGQARRLRTFAGQVSTSPWAVPSARVAAWLTEHPGTAATVKGYRQTLAAFYRWAVDAGQVVASPMPAPAPVTRYRLEQRWQDAVAAFETAQAAEHKSPATIAQRIKHVSRLAASASVGPWQLPGEEVQAWLESLSCGDLTRRAHRVSVAAFYRWGMRTGRCSEDPTALPSRRATAAPIPPLWAGELRGYRSYLRANGRPETTTALRMAQLGRFAREHPSLEPYAVTLDDLVEWLSGKRWAAETRRGMRAALVSFYRWAEDTGRAESNPTERLPIVRACQPRPRPALEEDYRQALAQASDREALALRLAAELGMRRAEVSVVHSRDLVGEPGSWALVVHGKGQRQRTIPLPRGLAETLRSLPAGYAFPGQDHGHLSPRYVGKLVSALLPPGVTMHALRHRFATRAYSIDRDVFTVQQLLGHASPATTQRYVQVTDDTMRRLVDAIAG